MGKGSAGSRGGKTPDVFVITIIRKVFLSKHTSRTCGLSHVVSIKKKKKKHGLLKCILFQSFLEKLNPQPDLDHRGEKDVGYDREVRNVSSKKKEFFGVIPLGNVAATV